MPDAPYASMNRHTFQTEAGAKAYEEAMEEHGSQHLATIIALLADKEAQFR